MPDVLSLKLSDVIGNMVKSWDEAGRPYNWLSGSGDIEDNLQGLLATSDCCILDMSMNSIMRLQLLPDTNNEGFPVLLSKLAWNPPVIHFEDLQTVAVEGSRFRLNPSCSFSRVQASQSCIQYHIQMDSCWLHWRSDTKLYEGIVPSCPVHVASHNHYEVSYIVTAVITTSLPKGVIFERNVRCQLKLKIIRADSRYMDGKDGTNAISDFGALPVLGKIPNCSDLMNSPKKDQFENYYDGDSGIQRSRKLIANRNIYPGELKAGSRAHGESIKPYQVFKDLHNSPLKNFSDRDSPSSVNKAKLAGENNVVKKLEHALQSNNLLKRRDYTDNEEFFSLITQPLPRTPKRLKCSKHIKTSKHLQSEWRSRCSRINPKANILYHLRPKSLSSEDLDILDFPSPYARLSRSDKSLEEKAGRFANIPYQEEQLKGNVKKSIPENISRDNLSEIRDSAYMQKSIDDTKFTGLSRHTEACDMVSHLDRVLLNRLGSNALSKRDWNSERCSRSIESTSTCVNQLQLHQSSLENFDKMSVSTCGSPGIDYPCIPNFPKSESVSSGSSSLASIFTKSKLGFYGCDDEHMEQIDYVNSKELSDNSSPAQTDYFYNSDTSTEENYTQEPPQYMISARADNRSVAKNVKIQNKKIRGIVDTDGEGNARSLAWQRTLPDSKPTEAWPQPVRADYNITSPIGSKQKANSSQSNFLDIIPQPRSQLESRYRCDTPMIAVTQDASTSSRSSCRAITGPSEHAITRLQKKYQDNYEYFASLKACGIQGTSHRVVGNEDLDDTDDDDDDDDDADADAENRVYENIFLETDAASGERESV